MSVDFFSRLLDGSDEGGGMEDTDGRVRFVEGLLRGTPFRVREPVGE